MDVNVHFDDEETMLLEYYAETLGLSVEDAVKGAVLYSIRKMYEDSVAEEDRTPWDGDPEEAADDIVLRQRSGCASIRSFELSVEVPSRHSRPISYLLRSLS